MGSQLFWPQNKSHYLQEVGSCQELIGSFRCDTDALSVDGMYQSIQDVLVASTINDVCADPLFVFGSLAGDVVKREQGLFAKGRALKSFLATCLGEKREAHCQQ